MAAVTMLDLAKTGQPSLDKHVMYLTAANSTIMADTRIEVVGTKDKKYDRYVDDYGSPDWSNIGVGFNNGSSRPEQLECTTYPFGINIDVDRRLIGDSAQIEDPRTAQLKAMMVGYGCFVSNQIINADPQFPGTDPNGNAAAPMKGVRWMLDNPSDEKGAKLDPTMKIDFNGVDLRGTVSNANARLFMRKMDEAIYRFNLGNVTAAQITGYLPSEIFIAMPDIYRGAAALDTTQDQFGRTFMQYGKVKLYDAGLSVPNRSPLDPNTSASRIIGWETAAGIRSNTLAGVNSGTNGAATSASSRYTSVFFIRHDPNEGFYCMSFGGQKTQDLGLLDDGVTYRTQVSDMMGTAYRTPWCVARGFDILIG